VIATVIQSVRVIPLIRAAEVYEQAALANPGRSETEAHNHAEDHTWAPQAGFETIIATLGANVLAGVGFALLITAALMLHGEVNWYRGLLWGVGGFASFALAPAVGLPPELPGMAAADLVGRQAWWMGTALATAGGLGLFFLGRRPKWAVVGAFMIIAPHLIGAPHVTASGAGLPPELIIEFGIASLVTNLLFWAALGIASGILFEKLRPAL
jgi:cobalt transporter subunit CbtA